MNTKRIIQLSPLISNQIAAGEVVERPASVIKELVENSIDAGATKIEIEIEGGGIHLIRVRDNGHGIVKDDLELAFSRHATSKIATAQDLASIMSLGFRGEALASIVSVAKCRLTSKFKASAQAWQVQIHPDLTTTISLASHSVGTTIEVTDLFYNTPVRRKFLRSEKSESLAIEDMIKRLALSYPHVTFMFKQNQKLSRQYTGASDARGIEARVAKICGHAFMEQAVALKLESESLALYGWIGHPTLSKRQADCQFFFVNRRMIKDRIISHAIKSIYQQHPLHVEGSYPAFVLYLDLDPMDVDVNVHPTKQEVRFSQSSRIHDFISKGVHQAWHALPTQVKAAPRPVSQWVGMASAKIAPPQRSISIEPTKRYILIENAQGLQIVDQQRYKSELLGAFFEQHKNNIPMKPLLFPLRVKHKLKGSELRNLQEYGLECRIDCEWLTLCKQPIFLDKPISEAVFIEIVEWLKLGNKTQWLKKCLFSLISVNVLSTLDLASCNLSKIPSVRLSHNDIENALEV